MKRLGNARRAHILELLSYSASHTPGRSEGQETSHGDGVGALIVIASGTYQADIVVRRRQDLLMSPKLSNRFNDVNCAKLI